MNFLMRETSYNMGDAIIEERVVVNITELIILNWILQILRFRHYKMSRATVKFY